MLNFGVKIVHLFIREKFNNKKKKLLFISYKIYFLLQLNKNNITTAAIPSVD